MPTIKQGRLRGDKNQYQDGVGCSVWYPFPNDDSEDAGVCFDFSADDIDDFILLLQALKESEPEEENYICNVCGSTIGHRVNCPNGIAFTKQRVGFYGNDGRCLNCNQPLEGASCPYCGWDDIRPMQYKYI